MTASEPHPALFDLKCRKAIAHAIDKQTLVDRVNAGIGASRGDGQPVGEPGVEAGDPRGGAVRVRPRKSREILDDAGYKDTDGDGIREMPGGGDDITLDYVVHSESAGRARRRRVRHRLAEGDRDRHQAAVDRTTRR